MAAFFPTSYMLRTLPRFIPTYALSRIEGGFGGYVRGSVRVTRIQHLYVQRKPDHSRIIKNKTRF
jgi:hypothetical protein